MITYNPVVKNGLFQVTHKPSGMVKKYRAIDAVGAFAKATEKMGMKPTLNGTTAEKIEQYKAFWANARAEFDIICIEETVRKYG